MRLLVSGWDLHDPRSIPKSTKILTFARKSYELADLAPHCVTQFVAGLSNVNTNDFVR